MVVVLAPSYRLESREAVTVRVALTPAPERIVSVLKEAGVRRLLAVRAFPPDPEFVKRAAAAGDGSGVRIDDRILSGPEELPRLLRSAGALADAVWLVPDPATVTRATFDVAREFSRAKGAPFFAPAAGLVSGEVRDEFTVSFHDCGREAARAAKELLTGRPAARIVYPRGPSERDSRPSR